MIKILNNPKVAPNFNLGEFMCKCGCNSLIYEPELVEKLQKVLYRTGFMACLFYIN